MLRTPTFRATASFDLVVGADGAWSRIRPLVSDARPIYSGVMFVEMGIDDADTCYPHLSRIVGRGLMFALGDSKAIIGRRDANAHIGIYSAARAPEDWPNSDGSATRLDTSNALKSALTSHFSDWSPDLLQLIHRSDERTAPRPIYALPVGHRWEHRPGVTLLGDAAHLMSPFGGDGANIAMQDGADLALALLETDWKTAVRNYEVAMFARAEEAAASARDSINATFAEDGLANMLQLMEGHHG